MENKEPTKQNRENSCGRKKKLFKYNYNNNKKLLKVLSFIFSVLLSYFMKLPPSKWSDKYPDV